MALDLTVDEIVNTLKRSSLTTVLVEGKDDVIIYRWIEEEIGIDNANFLPCNGRDTLLKVFLRRNEFLNIKTLFIADKDSYIYGTIPPIYEDIIWTNGYSIENDLYCGKEIEKLLDKKEASFFNLAISNFIQYYGFEVEKVKGNLGFNLSTHPNEVLCEQHKLKLDFLRDINYTPPDTHVISLLTAKYDLLIRGKSLFALLLRFLCHKNRLIKHNKKALLESCYKLHRSRSMDCLMATIKDKLYA
ncbi:MAG: DUF4435 domain-containing protein [Sporocytophaga sp.]|jgi:hypothetical protein|nr:DUF4435 domain-containing protein [Sporocytophaga sp.]